LFLLGWALAACTGASPDPRASAAPPARAATAPPASADAPATDQGVLAAWQGAWLSWLPIAKSGPTSAAGEPVALEITGERVTLFDGATETALELKVASSCALELTAQTGEGESTYYHKTFVAKRGGYLIGEGAAGTRKGKAAVVCDGSDVYTLDEAGSCSVLFMGRMKKPTECVWSKREGQDVLTIGSDWKTELFADGDVLESDMFRRWAREGYERKVADFATAKRLAGYTLQSRDDARKTDATAGKAGSLASVRDVVASAAKDAKEHDGKPVSLVARVAHFNFSETGWMILELVDSPGFAKPSLECSFKPALDLALWDAVTVSGTLDIRGDSVSLNGCRAERRSEE
jgi:hypothetical protein